MVIKLHFSKMEQLRIGDEAIIARSGGRLGAENWIVMAGLQVPVLCNFSLQDWRKAA